MKNFILLICVFVAAVFAAAPSTTTDVNYEDIGTIVTISGAAAFDTLGATDSSTLTSTLVNREGCEYILTRDAFTGSGSDSVAVQVLVDALDGGGTLLFRTIADTAVLAAGEAVSLPLVGGTQYRVKLKSIAPSGTVIILNRLYIVGRRLLTVTKTWR